MQFAQKLSFWQKLSFSAKVTYLCKSYIEEFAGVTIETLPPCNSATLSFTPMSHVTTHSWADHKKWSFQ